MKRKLILVSKITVVTFVICCAYNNFFTKGMLTGIYINQNYHYTPNRVEIPYAPDTLTLLKNNQFFSNYWGIGSYEIFYTLGGTEIELTYNYRYGKAGYRTSIKRINFGMPKIILDIDRDHYYEKLE
ncbi:hypothetical protein [Mucilaginibacter sp.]|uniref:hypothetical protein n=1 Tax=Mucilaginibacter sp. TaxID=1882438 RepID=UPI002629A4DD|nr:hypothetical protein [Mucilaginibacter sp.]MDB4920879.1 hypothetical protein [Mucilaginibacter sp.]